MVFGYSSSIFLSIVFPFFHISIFLFSHFFFFSFFLHFFPFDSFFFFFFSISFHFPLFLFFSFFVFFSILLFYSFFVLFPPFIFFAVFTYFLFFKVNVAPTTIFVFPVSLRVTVHCNVVLLPLSNFALFSSYLLLILISILIVSR